MKKISDTQAVCIVLLWFFLCYIILRYSERISFMTVFAVVASAVIVFVPLYKSRKKKD